MITNPRRRHLYNIAFKRSIKALGKSGLSGEVIAKESELMLERYYSDLGEMPGADMLELLADATLSEDFRETSCVKTRLTAYPVLSPTQIARRKDASFNGVNSEVELIVEEVDALYYWYKDPALFPTRPKQAKTYREPRPYAQKAIRDDKRGDWSRRVRERDSYKCQRCSSRSGIMHAHHIENYADNPHLRYELSNGITLCEPCHIEFHRIYGKRNNNREQINEYLTLEPIL